MSIEERLPMPGKHYQFRIEAGERITLNEIYGLVIIHGSSTSLTCVWVFTNDAGQDVKELCNTSSRYVHVLEGSDGKIVIHKPNPTGKIEVFNNWNQSTYMDISVIL